VSDPPSPKDPQRESDDAETAVLDAADIVEDVKRTPPPRPPQRSQAPSTPPDVSTDDDEPAGVFIAPMPIIALSNPSEGETLVEVGSTSIRRSSIPPRPPAPSSPKVPPPPPEQHDEITPPRLRPPADSLIQPVPSPRPPLESDPHVERPAARANGSSPSLPLEAATDPTAAPEAATPDETWGEPAVEAPAPEDPPSRDVPAAGDFASEEEDVPIDDAEEPEPVSVRRQTRSTPETEETLPDELVESAREPAPPAHVSEEPEEEIEPEPEEEERVLTENDRLIASSATEPAGSAADEDTEAPGDRVSEIPPEVDPADMEIHEAPAKASKKEGIVLPLPLPLHARADLGAAVQAQHTAEGTTSKRARYWWDELFGDDFLRTMDRLTDDQIKKEVVFIEESLGVEQGGMILDLACGSGRHAVEMSVRGYNVVGYDLSVAMLARAADEAHDRNQKLNFLHGDMRDIGFEEMFDGVYCWSTSFGYFDDEKNLLVAQRIHRALRKGGMLLLDVANRDFVTQRQPSLVWFEGDGCVCMDEMRVDFIHSRLRVKRMVMLDDGRTRELDYSIRLYTLHELGRLLHDVGFKVTEVSGHPATPGVFMGADSPRLIVLAEKA
jgi:SAM-dependent methyltransferase